MSLFRGLERRITEVRCPAKRTPTKVLVRVSRRIGDGRPREIDRPPTCPEFPAFFTGSRFAETNSSQIITQRDASMEIIPELFVGCVISS